MEHHITSDLHPNRAGLYQKELERARRELDEEKHKPLGLFDDMLNLLCWIETPEERLHKNRLASVTLGEVGRKSQGAFAAAPASGMMSGLAQRMLLALAKAK